MSRHLCDRCRPTTRMSDDYCRSLLQGPPWKRSRVTAFLEESLGDDYRYKKDNFVSFLTLRPRGGRTVIKFPRTRELRLPGGIVKRVVERDNNKEERTHSETTHWRHAIETGYCAREFCRVCEGHGVMELATGDTASIACCSRDNLCDDHWPLEWKCMWCELYFCSECLQDSPLHRGPLCHGSVHGHMQSFTRTRWKGIHALHCCCSLECVRKDMKLLLITQCGMLITQFRMPVEVADHIVDYILGPGAMSVAPSTTGIEETETEEACGG